MTWPGAPRTARRSSDCCARGGPWSRCSRRSTTSARWCALLPEWAHVRARPQRNAYHRFTVDRHLLEAVVECDALLDGTGRRVRRRPAAAGPSCSCSACSPTTSPRARPVTIPRSGPERAAAFATRIGLEDHAAEVVAWMVRHHLLMADTATRRDLADPETILRFGRAVHDTERLDLLYALTVADSRATGPSAWSSSKAALCRQLFVGDRRAARGRRRRSAGRGRAPGRARPSPRGARAAVSSPSSGQSGTTGCVECTVVARDRRGLLATVAGVLTLDRLRHPGRVGVRRSRYRDGARGVPGDRPVRPARRGRAARLRHDAAQRPRRRVAAAHAAVGADPPLPQRRARHRPGRRRAGRRRRVGVGDGDRGPRARRRRPARVGGGASSPTSASTCRLPSCRRRGSVRSTSSTSATPRARSPPTRCCSSGSGPPSSPGSTTEYLLPLPG